MPFDGDRFARLFNRSQKTITTKKHYYRDNFLMNLSLSCVSFSRSGSLWPSLAPAVWLTRLILNAPCKMPSPVWISHISFRHTQQRDEKKKAQRWWHADYLIIPFTHDSLLLSTGSITFLLFSQIVALVFFRVCCSRFFQLSFIFWISSFVL